MKNNWTLAEALRLWDEYRVVSAIGTDVEGIHQFIYEQLLSIQDKPVASDKDRVVDVVVAQLNNPNSKISRALAKNIDCSRRRW